MEIIVSHDVDHLRIEEHFSDRYLWGLTFKTLQSLVKGEQASLIQRFKRKLENIQELRTFNDQLGIKETYFFACRKGLSLSYDYQDAAPHVDWLLQQGVEVGLHGQSPDSLEGLLEEKKRLSEIHKGTISGIRNHYLRKSSATLEIMEKAGFLYDSTYMEIISPFRSGNLWEIPISVMDVKVLSAVYNAPNQAWEQTLALIQQAESSNVPYFVVNFHDVYFSEGWKSHKDWYVRLMNYLKERAYNFTTFNQAVLKLNASHSNTGNINN